MQRCAGTEQLWTSCPSAEAPVMHKMYRRRSVLKCGQIGPLEVRMLWVALIRISNADTSIGEKEGANPHAKTE